MQTPPPILGTERLEKTFASGDAEATVAAVRGVNLSVDRGEFVAVTGASGSGKSTLLHMLGGITRPTAGRVLLEGVDLATLDDDALAAIRRRRIGFVFQRYNLLPELSLLENVSLPLALDGANSTRCDAAARAALEAVGMDHRGPTGRTSFREANSSGERSPGRSSPILLWYSPTSPRALSTRSTRSASSSSSSGSSPSGNRR